MRHFSFLLMLIAIGLIAISCSHDEPEYYNQEATGETFIENGVLVKANTDFSTEMLTYALSKHEWKRVSIFYYDGENVSDKVNFALQRAYLAWRQGCLRDRDEDEWRGASPGPDGDRR